MRIRGDTLINETKLAQTKRADLVLDFLPRFAIQVNYTDSTPGPASVDAADVDFLLDTFTSVGHGFTTGLKGQFTTTGTLPTGISLATDYWIIRVSNDVFQLASSLSQAEAGFEFGLTDSGTGTHTFTPTAFGGAELALLTSNDNINFVELPSCTVAITSTGTTMFNVVEPAYRHMRFEFRPGSGAVDLEVILNGHGETDGGNLV